MKRFKNIGRVITLFTFMIVVFSGCDLINQWLGLGEEPKVTITAPEDKAYLSVNDECEFSGTYKDVSNVKLTIGEKEFTDLDSFSNGVWKITVNLSDVGPGEDIEVKAIGTTSDGKTVSSDPIQITIHEWEDAANPDAVYKWLILSDIDYNYPARLTDIVADEDYVYVAGYYELDTSHIQPFVYRVNPLTGAWDKKAVFDSLYTAGGTIPPVVLAIAPSKVYVAYSVEDMDITVEALNKELTKLYNYNDTAYSYIFYSMCYKDNYLYLTGEDYVAHVAFVFKIEDTGSGFGTYSTTTRDPNGYGSKGYDITIAGNDNLYVAAMVKTTSATDINRVVWEFNSSDLSYVGASNNETIDGEMYGVCYSASKDRLYATGVWFDVSDNGTVFKYDIDPSSLYLSGYDANFQQSNTGAATDEAGEGIIYDDSTGHAVIVGYQQATDEYLTDSKGSICIRSGGSEVKTIIFSEADFTRSFLRRVVKMGDKYYTVGYAVDGDGSECPLIMWVPDSF